MKTFAIVAVLAILGTPLLAGGETPANPEAHAYFVNLKDGDTVRSPVTIVFGLTGMGVAPAGIDKANTGHHHLLIDLAGDPELGKPLPGDDNHKHFGGGQTEVTLELAPGTHTLQLMLGDHAHVPHDPPVQSAPITIIVE